MTLVWFDQKGKRKKKNKKNQSISVVKPGVHKGSSLRGLRATLLPPAWWSWPGREHPRGLVLFSVFP